MKKARVIPLCKSGPVNEPENYRPKSILQITRKVSSRADLGLSRREIINQQISIRLLS